MTVQDPVSLNEKKEESSDAKDDKPIIEEHQLGIWSLKIGKPARFNFGRQFEDIKQAYPLFNQLVRDIYRLAPQMFVFFLVAQVWSGVEDAILMHLSSSLLKSIESSLVTGKTDVYGILSLTIARLLCSILVAYLSWHGEVAFGKLRSKVTAHFDMVLIKATLQMDLPTSKEAASEQEVSASDAWNALEDIIHYATQLLTASSQILLIAHLSRTTGGPIFALLCISKPILSASFSRSLWDKVCFAYIHDQTHRRMKALKALSTTKFRSDIISGNLRDWIIGEYEKTQEKLGDSWQDHPYYSYSRRESSTFDMVTTLVGDLPMAYCAFIAIMNPAKFSVASIAILQQSSSRLRSSLGTILQSTQSFRQSVNSVRKIYEAAKVHNTLKDGALSYPLPDATTEKSNEKGMGFELKDVCFSYPGSQKTSNALTNINLTVNPGDLIVIVGANGSGKSTLIRILSRLYDPTSGQILIDSHPSSSYRMTDLHRATAFLGQDNLIYPGLTLAENIGLGYPEYSRDTHMIEEAAGEGGAMEFMGKLKNGLNTTLDPFIQSFHLNLYGNKTHPLYAEMEQLKKDIDISGGERQRIVAARSFMRFKSGNVKFVAVDEPSSALDAEGELELFNRLIAARKGKTMIFVTHRFGHLTRHADQIVCMKDGSVAEVGSHNQLMAQQGVYANLYEIQSSAFDNHKNSIKSEKQELIKI